MEQARLSVRILAVMSLVDGVLDAEKTARPARARGALPAVLSGYATTQQGELCVSTFIGAMHPDHPMATEVLPVLFSWHLGIKVNDIAQSSTGAFDPERFWTAWRRGAAMTVDVVAAGWDFWGATEQPLDELRRAYGVPPVEPALPA